MQNREENLCVGAEAAPLLGPGLLCWLPGEMEDLIKRYEELAPPEFSEGKRAELVQSI